MDQFSMLQPPAGRQRREALPRHSAANPSPGALDGGDDGASLLFGNMRGNETTMVGEDAEDFYHPPELQTVLAGGYQNVRAFMTSGGTTMRKWTDTKIIGVLRLIQVQ